MSEPIAVPLPAIPRVVVLLLAACLAAVGLVATAGSPATADATTLYGLLNQSRQQAGKSLLVRDPRLDAVAQKWSNKLSYSGVLGHNPSYSTQIPAGWNRAGENVGYDYSDANLHTAWMNSPGHRENILRAEYTSVGIGWTKDAQGRIWGTQVFATYTGVTPPRPPVAAPATGNRNLLSSGTPGPVTMDFAYGRGSDRALIGDWDGDGSDTVGIRRGSALYLRNANSTGAANLSYSFGRSTDQVLVGDWDGDGTDTVGIRRGNTFYLANRHGGPTTVVFSVGRSTDRVVVGDWDGNGTDTIALRRDGKFFLTSSHGGAVTTSFSFGRTSDVPFAGDWDGDGKDTVAVRRSATYYLTAANRAETSATAVSFGRASDVALLGDFDDDGRDSLGVRR